MHRLGLKSAHIGSAGFELPPGRSGVILFDGVCNFCNRWVSFVLDNDPDGLFAFASLQSPKGRELLQAIGRDAGDLSTFVVIDEQGFHTQSSAALRVGATLRLPALNTLSSALSPLPPMLRDGVYRLVAENRAFATQRTPTRRTSYLSLAVRLPAVLAQATLSLAVILMARRRRASFVPTVWLLRSAFWMRREQEHRACRSARSSSEVVCVALCVSRAPRRSREMT